MTEYEFEIPMPPSKHDLHGHSRKGAWNTKTYTNWGINAKIFIKKYKLPNFEARKGICWGLGKTFLFFIPKKGRGRKKDAPNVEGALYDFLSKEIGIDDNIGRFLYSDGWIVANSEKRYEYLISKLYVWPSKDSFHLWLGRRFLPGKNGPSDIVYFSKR